MEKLLKNKDSEKRERLINGLIEEFGENGYNKASTNSIVKKAGISKGLLFHYFENKESLFKYVEEYVMHMVIETIQEQVDWNETDFFNRLIQVAVIKSRLTFRFPKIFDFFTSILSNMSYDDLAAYREELAPGLLEKVYIHNIDYSKFKPGLDMEKTMKIINWVIEKYSLELLDDMIKNKESFEYSSVINDFRGYMDILKKAFYK